MLFMVVELGLLVVGTFVSVSMPRVLEPGGSVELVALGQGQQQRTVAVATPL